jgi:hypothetical protein
MLKETKLLKIKLNKFANFIALIQLKHSIFPHKKALFNQVLMLTSLSGTLKKPSLLSPWDTLKKNKKKSDQIYIFSIKENSMDLSLEPI